MLQRSAGGGKAAPPGSSPDQHVRSAQTTAFDCGVANVSTSDGSAIAGTHYTPITHRVVFDDGHRTAGRSLRSSAATQAFPANGELRHSFAVARYNRGARLIPPSSTESVIRPLSADSGRRLRPARRRRQRNVALELVHAHTLRDVLAERMTRERDILAEEEILKVHEALDHVREIDARAVSVVEMRYFAGMPEAQIGEILRVTEHTVRRDRERPAAPGGSS